MSKLSQFFTQSKSLKFATIGFLALVLLIPAQQIKNIIAERESYQEDARKDISSKWGGQQMIYGPVLNVPFTQYNDGSASEHMAHFLPEELTVKGIVNPETRKRGIFKVLVYQSDLNISGHFNSMSFEQWNADSLDIHWQDSSLSLGITDQKGLKAPIHVNWNGSKVESIGQLGQAVQLMDNYTGPPATTAADFDYQLKVNGTEQLTFTPGGGITSVNLESAWHSPSFMGEYLPDKSKVTNEGFIADWKVLKHNRDYPQQWMDNQYSVKSAAFGVELIKPVDQYQLSMRSVKYAFLFISLTFITFFFTELLIRARMHPVQYTMVGIALLVFFTLLLALSEHIVFNLAYLIAATANVTLITAFAARVFKKRATTFMTGLLLALLYGFLFSVLQLEEHALLMGSIGLFVIVATLMFLSAKVNWYQKERSVANRDD